LLSSQCVEEGGEPIISVAYQEMPVAPAGGSGVRAAYTLDGERLWMRSDLNGLATVVEDVLVLGSTPEQPETAVDLRTGETIATFDPAVQSRTVVAADRVVVRGLSGPPMLTTLTGEQIARLDEASSYTSDGPLLFGTTPAALPDPGTSSSDESGGLTDASPSPSPTQSEEPAPGTGLELGEVRAYSLRTGEPRWDVALAPDPLGVPTVEPRTGIVVVTDIDGLAHGFDPVTGRQQWRTPTELENPRVTAASGIVLFDQVDEPFQKLVDARTGLPLPESEDPLVDLQEQGGLQMVDGVATVVSAQQLRTPPTTEPNG
jgi:outer membrane protein assembly factor BamB